MESAKRLQSVLSDLQGLEAVSVDPCFGHGYKSAKDPPCKQIIHARKQILCC